MYLFKPKYTRNGETQSSPNYAVEFRLNGKRHVKGLGTPNRAAASQRATALMRKLENAPWEQVRAKIPGKRIPLERIYELYREMNTLRARPLRERTVRENIGQLKSTAGHLGAETVEDLAATSSTFPRLPSVKHLSRRSVASVVRQANSIFSKSALAFYGTRGLTIAASPFGAGVPAAPPPEPFKGYSIEFVRELITDARKELRDQDPGVWAAFLLCLSGGLRQQEAAWLQAGDLHENGVMIVSREEHLTKSEKHRFIPLPPGVMDDLRKVSAGSSYVVPDSARIGVRKPERRGRAVFERLTDWLRSKAVDVKKPVHELRKMYGAVVATRFGIYAAKEMLGHSTVKVTEATYAALLEKPTVDFLK